MKSYQCRPFMLYISSLLGKMSYLPQRKHDNYEVRNYFLIGLETYCTEGRPHKEVMAQEATGSRWKDVFAVLLN